MFFMKWFKKKKKNIQTEIKPVELKDPSAIKHYVINLCEQMIDISRQMDEIRHEYQEVTSYLNDIQLVENLEGRQKEELVAHATNICNLTKQREEYLQIEHKISDATFAQMKEEEDEIPNIVKRLKSNEVYLDSIKRDLHYLEGEKVEWSVLRYTRKSELEFLRKLSYLSLIVFGSVAILVAILSVSLNWDTFLPIIIVAFLATLCGSYIILRIQDCNKEIKRCDVNQNYAISLENHVKIKYVNMKNAVDYSCEKYHVHNSYELVYNYEQFLEICKEQEKLRETNDDLEFYVKKMYRLLRGLNLYDVKIWASYAEAIIDSREMVEIKHDLFSRRQKLREQIEYNLNAIEQIQDEIGKYNHKMGDKEEQVNQIIHKVKELNQGIL